MRKSLILFSLLVSLLFCNSAFAGWKKVGEGYGSRHMVVGSDNKLYNSGVDVEGKPILVVFEEGIGRTGYRLSEESRGYPLPISYIDNVLYTKKINSNVIEGGIFDNGNFIPNEKGKFAGQMIKAGSTLIAIDAESKWHLWNGSSWEAKGPIAKKRPILSSMLACQMAIFGRQECTVYMSTTDQLG